MQISIVIPTFNRRKLVVQSIDSALLCLKEAKIEGEILVIDDASNDGTEQEILKLFSTHITEKKLVFHALKSNGGVNIARNTGVKLAKFPWIVFLDSDDALIPEKFKVCIKEMLNYPTKEMFFFRCLDGNTGKLVGPIQLSAFEMDIGTFLHSGTPGECLVVLKRQLLLSFPYDEDIRGFEGLAYGRILRKFGPAIVSPIALRVFNQEEGRVRLSTKSGIRMRARDLYRGYIRLLLEFNIELSFKEKIRIFAAILYYFILGVVFYKSQAINKYSQKAETLSY